LKSLQQNNTDEKTWREAGERGDKSNYTALWRWGPGHNKEDNTENVVRKCGQRTFSLCSPTKASFSTRGEELITKVKRVSIHLDYVSDCTGSRFARKRRDRSKLGTTAAVL